MRRTLSFVTAALVGASVLVAPVATAPVLAAEAPCDGAPRAPYVDVGDGHTHADAVDCLHGLGVVRGRAVDRFDPDTTLRRDQMATIIAGAVVAAGGQLPTGDTGAFGDVAGNAHRDAIERLAAAGIVQGRSDGSYDPAALVPRGQMTVFLVRAHDHVIGGDAAPAPDAFADDDGHQFEPFIDRAVELGLASGRTATAFAPGALTTRAQVATFVARLLTRSAESGMMTPEPWGFTSSVSVLPATLRSDMTGSSWRAGCPVGLDDLRLLEIVHRGFDGRDRVGLLVLHRDAVDVVRAALGEAYTASFVIERMRLVDRYGADDDRSMAANNTSAFNCRRVAGTAVYSQHSYGRAIDVNPVQNPYVSAGGDVQPAAGAGYRDRSDLRPGMLTRTGATVRAFVDRGWGWGGDWTNSKDYQHLSSTGR